MGSWSEKALALTYLLLWLGKISAAPAGLTSESPSILAAPFAEKTSTIASSPVSTPIRHDSIVMAGQPFNSTKKPGRVPRQVNPLGANAARPPPGAMRPTGASAARTAGMHPVGGRVGHSLHQVRPLRAGAAYRYYQMRPSKADTVHDGYQVRPVDPPSLPRPLGAGAAPRAGASNPRRVESPGGYYDNNPEGRALDTDSAFRAQYQRARESIQEAKRELDKMMAFYESGGRVRPVELGTAPGTSAERPAAANVDEAPGSLRPAGAGAVPRAGPSKQGPAEVLGAYYNKRPEGANVDLEAQMEAKAKQDVTWKTRRLDKILRYLRARNRMHAAEVRVPDGLALERPVGAGAAPRAGPSGQKPAEMPRSYYKHLEAVAADVNANLRAQTGAEPKYNAIEINKRLDAILSFYEQAGLARVAASNPKRAEMPPSYYHNNPKGAAPNANSNIKAQMDARALQDNMAWTRYRDSVPNHWKM